MSTTSSLQLGAGGHHAAPASRYLRRALASTLFWMAALKVLPDAPLWTGDGGSTLAAGVVTALEVGIGAALLSQRLARVGAGAAVLLSLVLIVASAMSAWFPEFLESGDCSCLGAARLAGWERLALSGALLTVASVTLVHLRQQGENS